MIQKHLVKISSFYQNNTVKIVMKELNKQYQLKNIFNHFKSNSKSRVILLLQKKNMPYQIRQFHILLDQLFQYENQKISPFQIQHSFCDIYVFKPCSVHIGVKFRDIKIKKYGFKIKAVQIKIDRQALELKNSGEKDSDSSHFRFYQKWKKHEVDFKYKLLKPSLFENAQELQIIKNKEIDKAEWKNDNPNYQQEISMRFKSFESQLQHLNIQLTQKIKSHLGKIQGLKGQTYGQNFINSWLNKQNFIKNLFVIHKKKYKMKSWESGKNIVETFSGQKFQIRDNKEKIHEVKALVMETFSEQDNKKAFIELKIDPTAIKKEPTQQLQQLNFKQLYDPTNKVQSLVQKHNNAQKYKFNISYPQLLQDLYKFCLKKQ